MAAFDLATEVFVRVPLLGAGPGLNFDLAILIFQVPDIVSAANTIVAERASASAIMHDGRITGHPLAIPRVCHRGTIVFFDGWVPRDSNGRYSVRAYPQS